MKRSVAIVLLGVLMALAIEAVSVQSDEVLAYQNGNAQWMPFVAGQTGTTSILVSSVGYDVKQVIQMLSVTTGAVTNRRYQSIQSYATFNGAVSSMGVASSAYAFFDWGYTTAFGNTVNLTDATAPASYSQEVAVDSGKTVYYQFRTTVGAVSSNGTTQSFTSLTQTDGYTGLNSTLRVIPLLIALGLLIGAGFMGRNAFRQKNVQLGYLTVLMVAVSFVLFVVPFEAIEAILTR